jgi:DNA-binding transcriptional LysR family regulator
VSLTTWTAFVEVARTGNLSAAAGSLGYTQSAVSRQIGTLEKQVGARLLTREARGVRLTPAGAALLPHARALVAEADRARRAVRMAGARGSAAIGAVPSAAVSLVPAALKRIRNGPSWTLTTGSTAELVERVVTGELDLAVVTDAPPGLPPRPGLATRHLRDDPMAVLLPGDHALAARRRVRIVELAHETWIEDNPGSEALLQALALRHDLVLEIDRSCGDLMTKIALVAAGHGVALVPASLRPALRPDTALVPLFAAPRRGVYAVTRSGRDDLGAVLAALAIGRAPAARSTGAVGRNSPARPAAGRAARAPSSRSR